MTDLTELYQEVILDHHRKPRNFGQMDGANLTAERYNPFCGDRVRIYLKLIDDVIVDISFQGAGCAISTASASLMTTSLKGKTRTEAGDLLTSFHALVAGPASATSAPQELGKLAVFSGVNQFPLRVKCATLAWNALKDALDDTQQGSRHQVTSEVVST